MKHLAFPLLALAVGIGAQVPSYPTVTRSTRIFHRKAADQPVLADLLVAYEEPPAGTVTGTTSDYLKALMISLSSELHTATGGAVQLGRVVIVPATSKADPDILILNDVAGGGCPGNIDHPETSPTMVCGEAHTGGYVGTVWWNKTKLIGATGSQKPVFETIDPSLKVGARVSVSWGTVKTKLAVPLLMHELGHYLFSMRDEYEGPAYTDPSAFTGATVWDPRTTYANDNVKGYSLTGALGIVTGKSGGAFLSKFNGYAMGLVTSYTLGKGYSPYETNPTVKTNPYPSPESDDDNPAFLGTEPVYAVTEQISTDATRGLPNSRKGGMWSLETTIRTALNDATYVLPTGKPTYDISQEKEIYAFSNGQENIIVFDRSGSMGDPLSGDNPDNITKDMVSTDFLARITHDEMLDDKLKYPTSARFGFIAFNDEVTEPYDYPVRLSAKVKPEDKIGLKDLTIKKVAPLDALVWESAKDDAGNNLVPGPGSRTDLVDALSLAKKRLNENTDLPVQRNVILITDGVHNWPYDLEFTGKESIDGGYRLFAVSVDSKLDGTDDYGTKLQTLMQNSMGPDGLPGQAFYASGYVGSSSTTKSGATVSDLAGIANSIATSINGMDKIEFPSTLYRDAAKDCPVQVDPTQTQGQFAVSWTGTIAPTLWLTRPDGQTLSEQNYPGINYRKVGNLKTFDIDLTKFPPKPGAATANWNLSIRGPNLTLPITILPSFASKSASRQVRVNFDPTNVRADGRLPVSVVVQDGRPIEGLKVSAVLTSRSTGVVRNFPLSWNGAGYSGVLANNLQPGVNDLNVTVVHPANGAVTYAAGENRLPTSLRKQYPYFAPVTRTQQIWVAGAATPKSVSGLSAVMINERPENQQGTTLKMFLRNNTPYSWTGLKVRYFFSVSEFTNGVPGVSVNYLAGGSKVTVGSVTNRPGLAYVQFDFAGKTLLPNDSSSQGSKGGEGVTVVESSWRSPWDPSNDWSAQGLKSTWAENVFVNIYDGTGKLISGSEDFDLGRMDGNAAPAVAISSSDLISTGALTTFNALASDPENDALTYAWSINGTTVTGSVSSLDYTFNAAGTYTVTVKVTDAKGNIKVASKTVVVQAATGACTDKNVKSLDATNINKPFSIAAGANCFVLSSGTLSREWKWSNLLFQANSDNGVALSGASVLNVLAGSPTNLANYSQTVPFANPGPGKSLYLKLQSNSARTIRLNWWPQ